MEKSIKGTRTEQNLLKAFAGESQARSRYVFFASKAKKEGYEQIAGVFAETAEQEKEHAERFFKFLEGGDVEITASYPTGPIGTCWLPLTAKRRSGMFSTVSSPRWPRKRASSKSPRPSR